MNTVLVIGVFAAMVLAPCLVASYSNLFPSLPSDPKVKENPEPEAIAEPVRVHPGHESPLSDPTVSRTR